MTHRMHVLSVATAGFAACALTIFLYAQPVRDITLDPGPPAAEVIGRAIVLESPGQEPRQILRYRFAKDARSKFELIQNITQSTEISGDKPKSAQSITTTARFSTKVASVSDTGVATIELTIDSMRTVSPTMSKKAQAESDRLWEVMKGVVGELTVDQRGKVISLDIPVPPTLDKTLMFQTTQLGDVIKAAIMCLPEEPVGVDALWRSADSAKNIAAGSARAFRLARVDGSTVRMEHRHVFEKQNEPYKSAKIPDGMVAFIEHQKIESAENRTLTLDATPFGVGSFETKTSTIVRIEDAAGQIKARNVSVLDTEFSLKRVDG